MAEFDQSFVARREDDDTLHLQGWESGPAGTYVVASAGIVVEVDAADSSQLTSIDVLPDADLSVLAEIIGDQQVDEVQAIARDLEVGAPARRVYSEGDVTSRPRGRERDRDRAPWFGLAAAAFSALEESDRSDAGAAAAFYDLLDLSSRTRADGFWRGAIEPHAAFAAELIAASAPELRELAASSQRIHEAFTGWPLVAAKGAGTALREVMELHRNMESMPSPMRDVPIEVQPPIETGRPVRPVDGVRIIEPNGIEVTLSEAVDGWWLEVHRRDGLVPLALVPFLSSGAQRRAQAVLPVGVIERGSSVASRLADVELVATPRPSRPDANRRVLVAGALDAGRSAVVAERLGQIDVARRWWRVCAERWREIDDDRRAWLASDYAVRADERSSSARVLITDLVSLHPTQR